MVLGSCHPSEGDLLARVRVWEVVPVGNTRAEPLSRGVWGRQGQVRGAECQGPWRARAKTAFCSMGCLAT